MEEMLAVIVFGPNIYQSIRRYYSYDNSLILYKICIKIKFYYFFFQTSYKIMIMRHLQEVEDLKGRLQSVTIRLNAESKVNLILYTRGWLKITAEFRKIMLVILTLQVFSLPVKNTQRKTRFTVACFSCYKSLRKGKQLLQGGNGKIIRFSLT